MPPQKMSSDSSNMTIRSRFDEILKKHISRLIEIDFASDLSFDLINVSSLILLVEKEQAVNQSTAESDQQQRYNKDTLFQDLIDLGVRIESEPEAVFSNLVDNGYAIVDSNDWLNAQLPAFAVVNLLNNLFPEMQGIHLVAYILQCIDEVVSGRKKIDDSIHVFDQTLMSRGVALGERRQTESRKDASDDAKPHSKAGINEINQKEYVHKLSKLRSLKANAQASRPSIITPGGYGNRKVEIKEIFRKDISDPASSNPPAMDTDVENNDKQPTVDINDNSQLPVNTEETLNESSSPDSTSENHLPDHERNSSESMIRHNSVNDQAFQDSSSQSSSDSTEVVRDDDYHDECKEKDIPVSENHASEPEEDVAHSVDEKFSASMSDTDAWPDNASPFPGDEETVQDERIDQNNDTSLPGDLETDTITAAKGNNAAPLQAAPEPEDEMKLQADASMETPAISDALIEKQIADFQEKIATPCPLCKNGRILSGETDKGKMFFSCNNPACPFVSWAKPWDYECPVCKNPFLTEFALPGGKTGLKCPKATCDYFQGNLEDPRKNNAVADQPPKKKVRKVRRVRRKR